jgi:hypothetical protein
MGKFVTGVQKLRENKMGMDDGHYFEDNAKLEDFRAMLESNSDKEKMEAMKRLIAVCGAVLFYNERPLIDILFFRSHR